MTFKASALDIIVYMSLKERELMFLGHLPRAKSFIVVISLNYATAR